MFQQIPKLCHASSHLSIADKFANSAGWGRRRIVHESKNRPHRLLCQYTAWPERRWSVKLLQGRRKQINWKFCAPNASVSRSADYCLASIQLFARNVEEYVRTLPRFGSNICWWEKFTKHPLRCKLQPLHIHPSESTQQVDGSRTLFTQRRYLEWNGLALWNGSDAELKGAWTYAPPTRKHLIHELPTTT